MLVSQFLGIEFDGNIYFPQKRKTYKIQVLTSKVFPHAVQPRIVTDFLETSFYHQGLDLAKFQLQTSTAYMILQGSGTPFSQPYWCRRILTKS